MISVGGLGIRLNPKAWSLEMLRLSPAPGLTESVDFSRSMGTGDPHGFCPGLTLVLLWRYRAFSPQCPQSMV